MRNLCFKAQPDGGALPAVLAGITMAPRGMGPDPSKIEVQGNGYLDAKFPRLDYIKKATIQ